MNIQYPAEHAHTDESRAEGRTQQYPVTRFAAVVGVQYALTNDKRPVATFRVGGVMLNELYPGEVAIIVVGGSYEHTVDSMMISYSMEIISDNPRQEVRFSARVRSSEELKSWTYLRFADRTVYTRFNRILWASYDKVTAREMLVQTRLSEIAYDLPSNFTKYCRQYLGEGYFDTLPDEDSDTEGTIAECTGENAQSGVAGDEGSGEDEEEELDEEDELIPVVYPDEMF
ncbi:hypothetical protein OH76DRAFT_1490236 [Lentinus brumalis]|uniref:Uncharacterized protein n=1 Tax=Lentinus brumalis TaxID=2498619 RepID=A0A371CJR2_9APHY|nr:hypothetical protein OH76DRAFT_1490236 [Polyporus brumalis]